MKALESQGFVVRRRSTSFVWMGCGDQILMVDLESAIPDGFLETLLASKKSLFPSSGGRRSRPSSLGSLGHFPRSIPKA